MKINDKKKCKKCIQKQKRHSNILVLEAHSGGFTPFYCYTGKIKIPISIKKSQSNDIGINSEGKAKEFEVRIQQQTDQYVDDVIKRHQGGSGFFPNPIHKAAQKHDLAMVQLVFEQREEALTRIKQVQLNYMDEIHAVCLSSLKANCSVIKKGNVFEKYHILSQRLQRIMDEFLSVFMQRKNYIDSIDDPFFKEIESASLKREMERFSKIRENLLEDFSLEFGLEY